MTVPLAIEQPAGHHLAQLNVGRIRDAMDSPRMAAFKANLDRVNAIAERSPGFVWRLQDETGNATSILTSPDPFALVNISVWETAEQLEHFVWNTVHKRFYEKKAAWFEPPSQPHFVMWWVTAGHRPSTDEALARLAHLRRHGPSAHAFGWEALPNIILWIGQRCA
jgi:hypothetical protein